EEEHDDHDDHDDHGEEGHDDHDDHDDHGEEEHDDHDDHDDHGEEEHDDHDDHDDHDEKEHDDHTDAGGHDEHHHDHGGVDPHAWMSPKNAVIWLDVIADTLSEADPENAETYQANAVAAIANMNALSDRLVAQYADEMGDHAVVTFHDTLRYFEDTYNTGTVITISMGDGQSATPSQMAQLQQDIAQSNPKCALTDEPGENTGMTALAQEAGLELRVLNPLGAGLDMGAGLYPALIERTFQTLAACR
ncbi:MAG: metal ABC transporter substrate-binding protein, partial [Pseudomonadota bacterium]